MRSNANRNINGGRPGATRGNVKVEEDHGFNGPSTIPQNIPSDGVTQQSALDVGIAMARDNRSMARPRGGGAQVQTAMDSLKPSPASEGLHARKSGVVVAPTTATYLRRR